MTIETKFNIDETVWLIVDNKITDGIVVGVFSSKLAIHLTSIEWKYKNGGEFLAATMYLVEKDGLLLSKLADPIQEKDLFHTKEELIAHMTK